MSKMLALITLGIVLSIAYAVYMRVVGLTWAHVRAGHFIDAPSSNENKTKCKWTAWSPCEQEQQTRYKVYAESEKDAEFECSSKTDSETQACVAPVCSQEHMPVCVCTEYDIENVCKTHKTYGNPCMAGAAMYTAGACE